MHTVDRKFIPQNIRQIRSSLKIGFPIPSTVPHHFSLKMAIACHSSDHMSLPFAPRTAELLKMGREREREGAPYDMDHSQIKSQILT